MTLKQARDSADTNCSPGNRWSCRACKAAAPVVQQLSLQAYWVSQTLALGTTGWDVPRVDAPDTKAAACSEDQCLLGERHAVVREPLPLL